MDRVAIYGRVSTTEQTSDNQISFLQEIVNRNGWELVQTYVDDGISGTKGRDKRPEFARLCKDMIRRKFNRILVWDISRLGRSLQHLVEFLNDVQSVNCHLYIYQSGLDTSTPSGRMMFQMVGVFSEFERSMISERVKLGLKRVKSKGTKLGRPTKIDDVTKEQVWNMVDEGKSGKSTFSSENSEEDMREYLEEGFSTDKLKTELTDKNAEFYFTELGDKVTGYLKVNVGQSQTEMKNENTLEIERIYVLKEFYGKKVGQTLYNKAIKLAKEKSVDYVWLGVWEHNPRAIRFYEKNGFVVFDKHIFKLGNDEQTDLMMKLKLKEKSQPKRNYKTTFRCLTEI